jgi:GntR family transcriptional regulator/MocR family aminotransferase
MRDLIFPVRQDSEVGLQVQLRAHLVDAIRDGRLLPDEPLPSSRRLAQALGLSRNTVVLAYQALADEGFLVSRERVGYFVNSELVEQPASAALVSGTPPSARARALTRDWRRHLKLRPSRLPRVEKVADWRRYPYPFLYGQVDPALCPVAPWRICSREALALKAIETWSADRFNEDDPALVEEVRTRVLPRRGIRAERDEILITMGAQNALSLAAGLLVARETAVGMEDPGYFDARNIFALSGARIVPLPVDEGGLVVDRRLDGCELVFVTPSHQAPTTVTLPLARRVALLERASRAGFLIIEDDYEAETNFVAAPTSALKAMDRDGAVIYVGSFSKSLVPGLRVGFLVAERKLVAEARLLRRLLLRHPPANNQRTVALFIAGGHYDALVNRLQRVYRRRWEAMGEALERHLPNSATTPSFGGTSYWVKGPESLDAEALAAALLGEGVIIEPGTPFFHGPSWPANYFRLGFSAIPAERIEPGVEILAAAVERASAVGPRERAPAGAAGAARRRQSSS